MQLPKQPLRKQRRRKKQQNKRNAINCNAFPENAEYKTPKDYSLSAFLRILAENQFCPLIAPVSMRSVLIFVMIAALSLGAIPLAYAQPRLLTPANATLVADSLIRLRWNPLSDASRYEIAIGWDSLFTLPTVQTLSATQNTITIRRTSLPYVPAELTAFWRVRARLDSVGVGAWSEVWRFTMPVPKTVPPIVLNELENFIALGIFSVNVAIDREELESPFFDNNTPKFVFWDLNTSTIVKDIGGNSKVIGSQMLYSAAGEMPYRAIVRQYDSTVINNRTRVAAPTVTAFPQKEIDTCSSYIITVKATNSSGWSSLCFVRLPRPVIAINPFVEPPIVLPPVQSGLILQVPQKLLFGQIQMNQITIASVPILTSSTATSGWLSLSAVPGVEYSLSSTGSWQPSLRVEWRSGQPKLERLWLRYTPQAIGQNFPVIRYVVNDSCDTRNHGLLRLEALATQPFLYAYTITSVWDAKAVEPVLEAVYPNPTSSDVTFALSLSKASRVKLTVCTTIGSILQTVADASLPAGRHSMTWQCAGLASGVYGYHLEVDGASVQSGFVSVVR